jgi:hypothetical protein
MKIEVFITLTSFPSISNLFSTFLFSTKVEFTEEELNWTLVDSINIENKNEVQGYDVKDFHFHFQYCYLSTCLISVFDTSTFDVSKVNCSTSIISNSPRYFSTFLPSTLLHWIDSVSLAEWQSLTQSRFFNHCYTQFLREIFRDVHRLKRSTETKKPLLWKKPFSRASQKNLIFWISTFLYMVFSLRQEKLSRGRYGWWPSL